MFGFETIALFVTVPLLAFFIVLTCFKRNTEKQAHRDECAELATELKKWGLNWAPKLAADWATSNKLKLLLDAKTMWGLFTGKDGTKHIMAELEGTLDRVLDVKLATVEGRNYVAGKLAAATKGTQ